MNKDERDLMFCVAAAAILLAIAMLIGFRIGQQSRENIQHTRNISSVNRTELECDYVETGSGRYILITIDEENEDG